MNVLDLFSGIGGFSLGLERAGMRTVAFCEIDPFARRVLAKHWPDIPIHHDVTKLRAADVGPVDVICGGFPCQDISTAGKGAGMDGTRSGLWSEYARLIGELRPNFVIVENVAALLGRGLDRVLGDLAALGFDAEWHCIPASAVGAPHRRDRLWIVAYPGCPERRPLGIPRQRLAWADGLSQWQEGSGGFGSSCEAMADATGEHGDGRWRGTESAGRHEPSDGSPISHTQDNAQISAGAGRHKPSWSWRVEPDVGRVAHGVPDRTHRLKGLGNAVVPQIPEIIGKAIMRVAQ